MSVAEREWVRSGSRKEYIQKTFGWRTLWMAAVVGDEVVNHAVEAVPVRAVVGVGRLRARDGDVRVGVALQNRVAHRLVGACEGDLHERAVVGPGGEVAGLLRLFGGVGDDRAPLFELRLPLAVERVERAVLAPQPLAKVRE